MRAGAKSHAAFASLLLNVTHHVGLRPRLYSIPTCFSHHRFYRSFLLLLLMLSSRSHWLRLGRRGFDGCE